MDKREDYVRSGYRYANCRVWFVSDMHGNKACFVDEETMLMPKIHDENCIYDAKRDTLDDLVIEMCNDFAEDMIFEFRDLDVMQYPEHALCWKEYRKMEMMGRIDVERNPYWLPMLGFYLYEPPPEYSKSFIQTYKPLPIIPPLQEVAALFHQKIKNIADAAVLPCNFAELERVSEEELRKMGDIWAV